MFDSNTAIGVYTPLFLIAMLSLFGSLGVFVKYRDRSPIANRDPLISAFVWWGLFGLISQMYMGYIGASPSCWDGFAWRVACPNLAVGIGIRFLQAERKWRLFMRLDRIDSDSGSEDEETNIRTKMARSNAVYLLKRYLAFHAIQVVLTILSLIYVSMQAVPGKELCSDSPFITATDTLNALFMVISLVYFSIKLRPFRDAYWIKKEALFLFIIALVFGCGGFLLQVLAVVHPLLKNIGGVLLVTCFSGIAVISYAIPSIMTLMNVYRERNARTDVSMSETADDFIRDSKLRDVLTSPVMREALGGWMVYQQNMDYIAHVSCIERLHAYSKLPEPQLPGFALAKIYNCYIVNNAYMHVHTIPEEMRKHIYSVLYPCLDGAEVSQDVDMKTLFDPLRDLLETFVTTQVLPEFFNTQFYAQARQKIAMSA